MRKTAVGHICFNEQMEVSGTDIKRRRKLICYTEIHETLRNMSTGSDWVQGEEEQTRNTPRKKSECV